MAGEGLVLILLVASVGVRGQVGHGEESTRQEGGFEEGATQGGASYPASFQEENREVHDNVKTIVVTKKVPVPYPVHVEKKVPYPVKVTVRRPFTVYVPKPYLVEVPKPVPYALKVPVPRPYTVEKHVAVPYEVTVDKPVPVQVAKPYPVYVEKKVPYPVEKRVPVEVKVPVERPYPVHVPVEKPVPYTVEKPVPVPVRVPVDSEHPRDTGPPPGDGDKSSHDIPQSSYDFQTYPSFKSHHARILHKPHRHPTRFHYDPSEPADSHLSESFFQQLSHTAKPLEQPKTSSEQNHTLPQAQPLVQTYNQSYSLFKFPPSNSDFEKSNYFPFKNQPYYTQYVSSADYPGHRHYSRTHESQRPQRHPNFEEPKTRFRHFKEPHFEYYKPKAEIFKVNGQEPTTFFYKTRDFPHVTFKTQDQFHHVQEQTQKTYKPQEQVQHVYKAQELVRQPYKPQQQTQMTYKPEEEIQESYKPQEEVQYTFTSQQQQAYKPQEQIQQSYGTQELLPTSYVSQDSQSYKTYDQTQQSYSTQERDIYKIQEQNSAARKPEQGDKYKVQGQQYYLSQEQPRQVLKTQETYRIREVPQRSDGQEYRGSGGDRSKDQSGPVYKQETTLPQVEQKYAQVYITQKEQTAEYYRPVEPKPDSEAASHRLTDNYEISKLYAPSTEQNFRYETADSQRHLTFHVPKVLPDIPKEDYQAKAYSTREQTFTRPKEFTQSPRDPVFGSYEESHTTTATKGENRKTGSVPGYQTQPFHGEPHFVYKTNTRNYAEEPRAPYKPSPRDPSKEGYEIMKTSGPETGGAEKKDPGQRVYYKLTDSGDGDKTMMLVQAPQQLVYVPANGTVIQDKERVIAYLPHESTRLQVYMPRDESNGVTFPQPFTTSTTEVTTPEPSSTESSPRQRVRSKSKGRVHQRSRQSSEESKAKEEESSSESRKVTRTKIKKRVTRPPRTQETTTHTTPTPKYSTQADNPSGVIHVVESPRDISSVEVREYERPTSSGKVQVVQSKSQVFHTQQQSPEGTSSSSTTQNTPTSYSEVRRSFGKRTRQNTSREQVY